MNSINESEAVHFLTRFNSFYDTVIRKVEIVYASDGTRNLTVIIATRDAQQSLNDGWVLVSLRLDKVTDFRFSEERKNSAQVISNGLHILFSDGLVGLDFGHSIDSPESFSELLDSKFFALGSALAFEVLENQP